jgi:hypothetical protein
VVVVAPREDGSRLVTIEVPAPPTGATDRSDTWMLDLLVDMCASFSAMDSFRTPDAEEEDSSTLGIAATTLALQPLRTSFSSVTGRNTLAMKGDDGADTSAAWNFRSSA